MWKPAKIKNENQKGNVRDTIGLSPTVSQYQRAKKLSLSSPSGTKPARTSTGKFVGGLMEMATW